LADDISNQALGLPCGTRRRCISNKGARMISRDDLATVDGVLVGTTRVRDDLRCFLHGVFLPKGRADSCFSCRTHLL
jgi:hypothetical protein